MIPRLFLIIFKNKTVEKYKIYLGDGAYAEFDGYNIILTTSNGIVNTNTIALEPDIFKALVNYAKKLNQEIANNG